MSEQEKNAQKKIQEFLDILEDELERQNLSVADFADMIGVTKPMVYLWLRGKFTMTLDKYYKALDALGLEENLKRKKKTKKNEKPS